MQRHRAAGRAGAVLPQRVERVGFDGDQFCARALRRLLVTRDLGGRVQPGIIADARFPARVLRQPLRDRVFFRRQHGEGLGVHLFAGLNRVAAVDEKRRLVAQDDGETGAAGKAGEPGQPLLAGRDIFVLVRVGAGNQEAVEFLRAQARAQPFQARRPQRRVGCLGEILKR